MNDKIILQELEFYAAVGVTAAERQVGQRLRATIELALDLRPAAESDDLVDTISYAEVADVVLHTAQQSPSALLERLAERIAAAVLARFAVDSVRVRLLKVPPPMAHAIAAAGVEILRYANDDAGRDDR